MKDKVLELNKPKRLWDDVQKFWCCNRCGEEWVKGHIDTCVWYKELQEVRS